MSPMASQTFLTWTETQTKVTDGVNILILGLILGKEVDHSVGWSLVSNIWREEMEILRIFHKLSPGTSREPAVGTWNSPLRPGPSVLKAASNLARTTLTSSK